METQNITLTDLEKKILKRVVSICEESCDVSGMDAFEVSGSEESATEEAFETLIKKLKVLSILNTLEETDHEDSDEEEDEGTFDSKEKFEEFIDKIEDFE
jgi:heptaprenylglyceryl phosphate synthase